MIITMNWHDGTVKKICVHFHHDLQERRTICTIHLRGKDDLVLRSKFATAYAARCDQFNKSTGRKIALERALVIFPRIMRTVVWEAYWKEHRKPC